MTCNIISSRIKNFKPNLLYITSKINAKLNFLIKLINIEVDPLPKKSL